MRISSASQYEATIDGLQQRQQEMSQSQARLTAGKRIAQPSDDPAAAARAERAFQAGQRIVSAQRSVEASRSAMQLAESALGQTSELLQSARETLIAAGNGSYSASDRASQALQLTQLRAQLMALANQSNSAGGYLFGGQGGASPPFLDAPGGVQSTATSGQSELSSTDQMPLTVDGQAIWLAARSGNGVFVTAATPGNTGSAWIDAGSVNAPADLTGASYSISFAETAGVLSYSVLRNGATMGQDDLPFVGAAIKLDGMTMNIKGRPAAGDSFSVEPSAANLDIFKALNSAIAVLKDPLANSGHLGQAVNSGLRDLNAVMGHFQAARTETVSALSRLDAIEGRNQDRSLWAKSVQSAAEDLDMVQAISSFQNQQTGYQAAMQSYAMVQRLSLFDYVK